MTRVEELAAEVAALRPHELRTFLQQLEARLRAASGDAWERAAEEFIARHKPVLEELAKR